MLRSWLVFDVIVVKVVVLFLSFVLLGFWILCTWRI